MNNNNFLRIGSLFTDELIKLIDQSVPHRCPDPKDSIPEMWMKAGERRLVDVLIAKFNEANEDNMVNMIQGQITKL